MNEKQAYEGVVRIPPELQAEAKELVSLLEENKDFVIHKGKWIKFIWACAGVEPK